MRLQELLGVHHPLIQAPMAGVQDYRLSAAVSATGALGSLPAALLTPDALRQQLQALDGQRCNVNFFCHRPPPAEAEREAAWRERLAPYYAEFAVEVPAAAPTATRQPFNAAMAQVLEEYPQAVVSFHFGLPDQALLQRVRATGAKILSSATTVQEAQWLQARGVDAIIAQGLEAGGHRGIFLDLDLSTQLGTFALLPQVVAAVQVPVIAAGGIATAQGVAAAMRLGASGVQIGSSYLLCPEATTSAVHRRALQGPESAHTALTNLFTGRPARSIVNRLIRELGPLSPHAPSFPLAGNAIAPLRAAAEQRDSGDCSPLWAGQNLSGCQAIPAAELTRRLLQGLAM